MCEWLDAAEKIWNDVHIAEIKNNFLGVPARSQAYLIKGVHESRRVTLLEAIVKEFADIPDWIAMKLNLSENLIDDLFCRLSGICETADDKQNERADIPADRFEIWPERDSVSRCEEVLNLLKEQNRKVLIVVDDVRNTQSMKVFVSQFQIWIRSDYPVFLMMAGLNENISAIQNDPQLSFLLRTPKITLGQA